MLGLEEEEKHPGRANSSRPIGPYEAVCDVLYYLIYGKRSKAGKGEEEEDEEDEEGERRQEKQEEK